MAYFMAYLVALLSWLYQFYPLQSFSMCIPSPSGYFLVVHGGSIRSSSPSSCGPWDPQNVKKRRWWMAGLVAYSLLVGLKMFEVRCIPKTSDITGLMIHYGHKKRLIACWVGLLSWRLGRWSEPGQYYFLNGVSVPTNNWEIPPINLKILEQFCGWWMEHVDEKGKSWFISPIASMFGIYLLIMH